MADNRIATKAIAVENFLKIPNLGFLLIGFRLRRFDEVSPRWKFINKAMRRYFVFALVNIYMFISCFYVKFFVDIRDIDTVIRVLPNMTLVPYNTSKSVVFYIQRSKIISLLENLNENLPKGPKTAGKLAKELKTFVAMNIFYIVTYVCIMTLPTMDSAYDYLTTGVRKQFIEMWFPFDDTGSDLPFFASISWAVWAGSNVCVIIVSGDFFIFGAISVLSLLFEALGEDLKVAIDSSDKTTIKKLIERHQKLMEICDELQRIFSFVFVYSFLNAGLALGFSGFQLAKAKSMHQLLFGVPYTLGVFSQIFFYCHFGQKLIDSSFGIASGICGSNWHTINENSTKKMLLLMMARSQKPKELSILGFSKLMIETFTKVSTSAYSYFALLKEIYAE